MNIYDLQDAIVAELNTAFSGQFVATAEFTPNLALEDNENIKVPVVPGLLEDIQLMNRAGVVEDSLEVQIGIIQRSANDADTRLKLVLADTVRKHFNNKDLTVGGTAFIWKRGKNMPLYDYQDLDESKQVTSIITLVYKEYVV